MTDLSVREYRDIHHKMAELAKLPQLWRSTIGPIIKRNTKKLQSQKSQADERRAK